jgi:hypothetical protein
MSTIGHFEGNLMEANLKNAIIGTLTHSHYLSTSHPLILHSDQAKLIYGTRYPQGHDWSVIPESYIKGTDDNGKILWECAVHVIVYPTPGTLADRITVYRMKSMEGRLNTLEDLWVKFQEKMNDMYEH